MCPLIDQKAVDENVIARKAPDPIAGAAGAGLVDENVIDQKARNEKGRHRPDTAA